MPSKNPTPSGGRPHPLEGEIVPGGFFAEANWPRVFCFPPSSPLFKEEYNVHANHFHIPQWLTLTVVPIIYHSIFEHTQHLDYSSRPWSY